MSEEPPYPWETLRVPIPEALKHNGTLDVRIQINAVMVEGIEWGIALDWFSATCELDSGCILDVGVT